MPGDFCPDAFGPASSLNLPNMSLQQTRVPRLFPEDNLQPEMFETTVTRALARLGLDQRGTNPHPRNPAPMLLGRADKMFASPDWVYEPKWDGFRVLASVQDGSVRLISRNGHSFTNLFGPVTDVLRGFPTSILLDGEVIAINDKGQPDFEALQARLRPRNGKLPGHLCYMVFDCLYVNGHSLLNRPLEERQAVLWELQHALQTDVVKLTEGFPAAKSARLMKACAAMGLEGVIMKRKRSIYRPGFQSADWLKVPLRHREEFVVAGYLPSPRGFSTLILGQFNREGNFAYAGFCGTGLSDTTPRGALGRIEGHTPEDVPVPNSAGPAGRFSRTSGYAAAMGAAGPRGRG